MITRAAQIVVRRRLQPRRKLFFSTEPNPSRATAVPAIKRP